MIVYRCTSCQIDIPEGQPPYPREPARCHNCGGGTFSQIRDTTPPPHQDLAAHIMKFVQELEHATIPLEPHDRIRLLGALGILVRTAETMHAALHDGEDGPESRVG